VNAPRTAIPLLLAALLASPPAPAQTKGKAKGPSAAPSKATPANAKWVSVKDRRTAGSFPSCTLGIELADYTAWEVTAARVVVTTAVDDLGTSLVKGDGAEARLEPTQRGQLGKPAAGKPAPPSLVFAEMKNPPRKAKALKEVSGEIELLVPSRDPNGEAKLAGFLGLAGKPIANAALRANGVEISILTKAQVDAERKKAEAAETAKLKKEGYDDPDTIRSTVESALSYFPKGEEGEVVLKVKDPKKAVQEIKAFDGKGERVFSGSSEQAGFRVLSFWNEKPKPDWSLSVVMVSDRSLVRHTFTFRDVPLP